MYIGNLVLVLNTPLRSSVLIILINMLLTCYNWTMSLAQCILYVFKSYKHLKNDIITTHNNQYFPICESREEKVVHTCICKNTCFL